MSTTRIKDKISAIVSSQLPEFVQTDYTTFVSFIEAYYRFLEQDQAAFELIQNSRSYGDIDKTVDSFVKYFINTYAKDLPESSLANKKLLIKRIKDLYESKGSELSFKLLFNLIFQVDVDVAYPYENVLIASGGKWNQQNSIRVRTVSGSIDDILNRFLDYRSSGVDFSTPILRVKILSSTLTELFLDPRFTPASYTVGDTVTVSDANGIIFSGTVSPTTLSYNINRPGAGFRVGQVYTINSGGGVGTLIRVSAVNSTGGITQIKFINYGFNFPNQLFSVDLDPTKNISETSDILSDTTQGFSESVGISIYDPTSGLRYFLEQYTDTNSYTFTSVNVTTSTSFTAATSGSTKPPAFATIQFSVGGLAKYQGSYLTNDSFISEADIRLQDDLLYQPFAYQTVTSIDISDFFDIITQIVHPAGQRLFNNRLLSNAVDVSANISVISKSNVFTEAISVFDVLDSQNYSLSKIFEDTNNAIEQISLTLSTSKFDFVSNINDTLPTITINKEIDSNVDLLENGNLTLYVNAGYFAENYDSEEYAANIIITSNYTIV